MSTILTQQKMMLADVKLKLEAVRDNVKICGFFGLETHTNLPIVPPLRHLGSFLAIEGDNDEPHSGQRAKCSAPLDIDTDEEDAVEWQTVQHRPRTKGKA